MFSILKQSTVLGLGLILGSVCSFNLSPKPNYVFLEPKHKTTMPKVRSSYFGFSVVLRENSIIVGAPRAQSTLPKQQDVNEPGAIFKCSIATGSCAPFVFDSEGNYTDPPNNGLTYDSEIKDNQWLGGSMDGGSKDKDRLVVCAPRRMALVPEDYLMNGVCYWTTDTSQDRPQDVIKISPLKLQKKQIGKVDNKNVLYYKLGEKGISVHIPENSKQIIIGAPGIYNWKGSIIRYYEKKQEDSGGLSRRDLRGKARKKREATVTVDEILNPQLWGQSDDSYLGYAVASNLFGDENKKLLYITTAPQAKEQSGEAYLFDIVKFGFEDFTMKIHHIFLGRQFGEYFGYSVISEDLNNDGKADVIVSAPQHASPNGYDQGAVYVFINKGNTDFDLGNIITSGSSKPGRFGTALSKLGDINQDGYKDVAISAPFEDDGVVYIYLGSDNGLREKPSQALTPSPIDTIYKPFMFGHGLSKGVDVDRNGFNDIAIGAPNAEAVLVYRAYPVIEIQAMITSPSRAISLDQTKFEVEACYQLKTTSSKVSSQLIAFTIIADSQVKRVKFAGGSNEFHFNSTATASNQCKVLEANVKLDLQDIFKRIELEMKFEVINKVPDSTSFCEHCVAVDPSHPTSVHKKIAFSTGCRADICEVDLELTSSDVKSRYILGSSRTFSIKYKIKNSGEIAYLPQINITSSQQLSFAKIPPSCILDFHNLICDLNQGQPMPKDSQDTLTVSFDTNKLNGKSVSFTATVLSAGKEISPHNNKVVDLVDLVESSEIESMGWPLTPPLNLEDNNRQAAVKNHFEIRNNGPSNMKEMVITISIPIRYQLIDISNITISATHNNKPLYAEFYHNNSLLIQNAVEISSGSLVLNKDRTLVERRRRSLNDEVIEDEYSRISQKSTTFRDLAKSLPANKTIQFNCTDREETPCIEAILKVYNFNTGDSRISITLQYNVDLDKIQKILLEPKEFVVITTPLDISKTGDKAQDTFTLKKIDPHNIISKYQLKSTPAWVYIVSALAGILILALLTYGLYKLGFFKREKKDLLHRTILKDAADDTEDEE